jgi:hypothetical protein
MNTRLTVLLACLALPAIAEVELPPATTSFTAPALDGVTGMGASQAMNDSYIVLGAPDFDHPTAQNAGAAYVFSATTRKLIRRLTSPVLVLNERFGQTVAIYGSTAYIGAGGNDTLAANGGAVYAFDIPTGRRLWSNQGAQANAEMGAAALVANQDYVLVGIPKGNAPGKPVNSGLVRWITRRTGATETSSVGPSAAMNDAYGTALASSGGTIAIGAPFADEGNTDRGCVYLMTNPESIVGTLSLTGGIGFGSSVALHGRTLVAAAGSTNFAIFDLLRNSAFRFIDAPINSGTPIGSSLAVMDDLVFVSDPNYASEGRVLVYDVSGSGTPTPLVLPTPPGLPGGADFSNQVLAYQGRLLVGTSANRSTTFDFQNIRRTLSQQFTEVASTGTVAPGISGASIASFTTSAMNYAGVASHAGTFRTAGSPTSQSASWGTTSGTFDLMSRAGDPVAALKVATVTGVIQNGLKRALMLSRLTPGNKLAVLSDDGVSITTLMREGGPTAEGKTLARIHSVVQPQQTVASPTFTDYLAASGSLQTGIASVNTTNDSAILLYSGSGPTPMAQEGSSEPVSLTIFGQMAPRVARWKNDVVFACALQGAPTISNAAVIRRNISSATNTIIARKGDPATGVTNGKFSTFLGECVNTSGSVLFRATLTGIPVTQNEGLWLYSSGTLKLLAQKNTGSAAGVVWSYRRLLKFFLLDNNEAVIHIQNSGPKITSANDDLVLAIESDGNGWRRVFEEGKPADSCGEARYGPLQRVDVDTSGHVILTATLLNSPAARNVGLFAARTTFSGLASQSMARLQVRKGGSIDRIGSETITAVTLNSILPATGAGNTGAAKVTAAMRSVFSLQFADKTQTLLNTTP